ncbi:hypothetical protein AGMMS49940_00160 [Spirochaetia bacterium]|nr:hypothetical protein AGMMS49940_00160 [Spirochaetia bacterium]
MRNITLAIDEQTLALGRQYAQKRKISFNQLVRRLVEQTVNPPVEGGLDKFLALAEEAHGHSGGQKWTRDELHERR